MSSGQDIDYLSGLQIDRELFDVWKFSISNIMSTAVGCSFFQSIYGGCRSYARGVGRTCADVVHKVHV